MPLRAVDGRIPMDFPRPGNHNHNPASCSSFTSCSHREVSEPGGWFHRSRTRICLYPLYGRCCHGASPTVQSSDISSLVRSLMHAARSSLFLFLAHRHFFCRILRGSWELALPAAEGSGRTVYFAIAAAAMEDSGYSSFSIPQLTFFSPSELPREPNCPWFLVSATALLDRA